MHEWLFDVPEYVHRRRGMLWGLKQAF